MKKLRKVSPGSRLMIVMTKVLADSVRDVPYKDQNRIPTPDPIDQTNKRAKDLRTGQGRALVV
jgi:hypothetical protein